MKNLLVRDTLIYGVGAVLTKSLGILLIPLYTRYFTVEEYGTLALLNMILRLLTFVLLFGVSSAAMRLFFDKEKDETYRRLLYGNALLLLVVLPAALMFALGPMIYIITHRFLSSISFFPYVFITLMISIFIPVITLQGGHFRVRYMSGTYIVYTVSFFVIQTFSIIIAVAVLGFGLKGQLYAQLVTNILFWIVAIAILRRNAEIQFQWRIVKDLLVFGLPLIPFFIFNWINVASGRFLLEWFEGLKEVGIYALAAQFSGLLVVCSNAFENALVPHYYQAAQGSDGSKKLGALATKYIVVFGLLSLAVIALARPLMYLMATDKFMAALSFIPLLVFADLLSVSYKFFHWNIMQAKRTGLVSAMTIMTAVMSILLLVVFLGKLKLGIYGVAFALIIVQLLRNILGYIISQRLYRISYKKNELLFVSVVLIGAGLLICLVPADMNLTSNTIIKLVVLSISVLLLSKIAGYESIKELFSLRKQA